MPRKPAYAKKQKAARNKIKKKKNRMSVRRFKNTNIAVKDLQVAVSFHSGMPPTWRVIHFESTFLWIFCEIRKGTSFSVEN